MGFEKSPRHDSEEFRGGNPDALLVVAGLLLLLLGGARGVGVGFGFAPGVGVGVGVELGLGLRIVGLVCTLEIGLGLDIGFGLGIGSDRIFKSKFGFGFGCGWAALAAATAGIVGSAAMLYMTEHSPSCCLRPVMLLREMRSRCRGAVRPDRFRSSSLSRALGKSWAVLGSVSRLYPVVLG